jgi:hypothetical protein
MRIVYAVLFTTLSLPVYAQDIITLGCKRLTGDVPAYNEFSLDLDHLYVIDNIFEDIKIITEVKDAAITYLILKP